MRTPSPRTPHRRWSRCGCEDCTESRGEDSLRHSRRRINAYRALASPSLIALSSKDPILTAFELSWELRRLAFSEHEFKSEYLVSHSSCLIHTVLLSQYRPCGNKSWTSPRPCWTTPGAPQSWRSSSTTTRPDLPTSTGRGWPSRDSSWRLSIDRRSSWPTPMSSSCLPPCGMKVCRGSGRWTWSSRLLTSVVLVSSFPSTPSATSYVPGLPSQCPWGNPSSNSSVTLHPTSSSYVSKSYLDAIFEIVFDYWNFSNILSISSKCVMMDRLIFGEKNLFTSSSSNMASKEQRSFSSSVRSFYAGEREWRKW